LTKFCKNELLNLEDKLPNVALSLPRNARSRKRDKCQLMIAGYTKGRWVAIKRPQLLHELNVA